MLLTKLHAARVSHPASTISCNDHYSFWHATCPSSSCRQSSKLKAPVKYKDNYNPKAQREINVPQLSLSLQTTKSPARVNCSAVDPIEPVHLGHLFALPDPTNNQSRIIYPVSLAWWDARIHKVGQKQHPQQQPTSSAYFHFYGNPTVDRVARILLQNNSMTNTDNNVKVMIDVGANVGFMTHLALQLNYTVFAVEPIAYNIAKLCEAQRHQQQHDQQLYLYQAAAGSTNQPHVTITRPSSQIGFFDQTSLTKSNVDQAELVQEDVPMVTIDSLLGLDTSSTSASAPASIYNNNIQLVKIDVQGHEHDVLRGMHHLLSHAKTTQSPRYVLYESNPRMMKQATRGEISSRETQTLVESYGYWCEKLKGGDDTLCTI